jgi:hypothetical protein
MNRYVNGVRTVIRPICGIDSTPLTVRKTLESNPSLRAAVSNFPLARTATNLVSITITILLIVVSWNFARAQQATTQTQQSSDKSASGENNGQDLTRPEDLFQLRYLYRTAPGSGPSSSLRTVTMESEILRTDKQFDLGSAWKLALRGDLPFTEKNPLTADNPTGDFQHGVGDADVQATLIHQFDSRWAAGAGLRIIAPTGEDNLTSGKWQAQPVIGVRYSLPELSSGSYFEPILRYAVSFAGDPSKKDISNLQFAPMVNIALPDHWFLTLYPTPDIRVNYGDPVAGQTGRLFLPLDFMVGRSIAKGVTISAELGIPIIKDYPVYDFKTVVRFNAKF